MESLRNAWKIFTFSDYSSGSHRGRKTSSGSSSSNTALTRPRSSRRHPRCIPLHRACSVPVSSVSPVSIPGRPGRSVRPGAYEVVKSQGAPRQHRVLIPFGTEPGSEFTAIVGTQDIQVQCPATSKPGNFVRVMVPGEPIRRQTFLKVGSLTKPVCKENKNILWAYPVNHKDGSFKVWVPPRVRPGMTFVATIKRKQYSITCPDHLPENRKIRVSLDKQFTPTLSLKECTSSETLLTTSPSEEETEAILNSGEVCYDEILSHGWTRRVRPWDGKFQWVSGGDEAEAIDQFDDKRSVAYCRKLLLREGKDQRLPTGTLGLVTAEEATADSSLEATTVSADTICTVRCLPLEEKMEWFQNTCQEVAAKNKYPGVERSVKLVVRREDLLEDSIKAVMSLGTEQLQNPWKIEFVHEPAVDAGGVTREWFQIVSEQLFDPENGLWISGEENQMCLSINPDSAAACSSDHLLCYRFAGRLLGRALFDQQIIDGHLAQYLYKHLLGWPLVVQDLANQDQMFYDSLKKLMDLEDIGSLSLDFTVTEEIAGKPKTTELVPGGATMSVTKDNLQEYYQAQLRYRVMKKTKPQLAELLLGFFDVLPEAPLAVFDPAELELMLCGLPNINVEDWKANTRYSGTQSKEGEEDVLVTWFWELLDDFDHEKKARLLQFATGTAGVPSKGFGALRGSDGAIKTFCIHVAETNSDVYPRAHTCFNRIDLPRYESKEELSSKLETALSISAVGFGMN